MPMRSSACKAVSVRCWGARPNDRCWTARTTRVLRPALLGDTGNVKWVGLSRNACPPLGGFFLSEATRFVGRASTVATPEEDGTTEEIALGPVGRAPTARGTT